jgi:hypothetical protein
MLVPATGDKSDESQVSVVSAEAGEVATEYSLGVKQEFVPWRRREYPGQHRLPQRIMLKRFSDVRHRH